MARIAHPYWDSVDAAYAVQDISYKGVSTILPKSHDLLRGWRIFELSIYSKDTQPFVGTATLQHVSCLNGLCCEENPNGLLCGFRILEYYGGEYVWFDYVDSILHTIDKQEKIKFSRLWNLYKDSGYFHLSGKKPSDFKTTKRAYKKFLNKLTDNPSLGTVAVYKENREIVATVACIRHYRNTWQLMHLAKHTKRTFFSKEERTMYGRRILREIYLKAIENAMANDAMAWFLTYARKGSYWTQKIHHDFSAKCEDSANIYNKNVTLIEIDAEPRKKSIADDVVLSEITSENRNGFVEYIKNNYPEPFYRGLDLMPPKKGESAGNEERSRSGEFSVKKIVQVSKGQEVLGYGCMETSNSGLSLFGLFDNLWIHSVDKTWNDAIYPAVIDYASKWFRIKDKRTYILFVDTMDYSKMPENSSSRILGEGVMHIISKKRLPTFLEHVFIESSSI